MGMIPVWVAGLGDQLRTQLKFLPLKNCSSSPKPADFLEKLSLSPSDNAQEEFQKTNP